LHTKLVSKIGAGSNLIPNFFQNEEKQNRAAGIHYNKELFTKMTRRKTTAELIIANKELAYQNDEKRKSALINYNKELAYQNDEKENRAAALIIANKELAYQMTKRKIVQLN
jgi:hypothetical protein